LQFARLTRYLQTKSEKQREHFFEELKTVKKLYKTRNTFKTT